VLCLVGFGAALVVAGPGSDAAARGMTRSMSEYGEDTEVTAAWDWIQTDFRCCGVRNGTDWARNATLPANVTVPASCCRVLNSTREDCAAAPTPENSYLADGCLSTAQTLVTRNAAAFIGVSLAVVVFLALSTVMAFGVSCNMRRAAAYERLTV